MPDVTEFLATYWSHSGKKPARSFSSVTWCTTIRAVTSASADKPHSEEDEDQGKEYSRPCEWQEGARSILIWHGELGCRDSIENFESLLKHWRPPALGKLLVSESGFLSINNE